MHRRHRLTPLFAILLAPLLAGPADAFEPTGSAVADGFLRIVESGGFEDVSIEASGQNDEGTVLTGLSASAPARSERLTIGAVVIVDGLIDSANALRADVIQYADVTMTNIASGSTSSAAALTVTGPRLPMRESSGSWLATVLGQFDGLVLEDLAARPAEGRAVAVTRVEITRDADAGPASGRIAFQGATVDAAFFQGTASTLLTDLGYDTLTLSGALEGRWDETDGSARLSELAIAASEVGALVMSGEATGLSAQRVAALQRSAGSVTEMLPLLQEVRVAAFTVAFKDDGLTARLLARTAAQSGVSADRIRTHIVEAVRDAMTSIGTAEFAAGTTDAIGRFLAQPGTLTISMAPADAVNVAQLLGGALLKPQLLPQLLNLSITAEP